MRISYRIALELFPSFSLWTRTRDLLVLLLVEQRPDLRASPGHVLRDDVLTSVPAQLVLAAMGRRGCDGATRVNELLWRRDTTPDVDDNRRECSDIDRASWSLVGTIREGMSRHLATPFRRGRRKVDLRRRPARAEESGQATKGGQGSGEEQAALEERARDPFRNGSRAQ